MDLYGKAKEPAQRIAQTHFEEKAQKLEAQR